MAERGKATEEEQKINAVNARELFLEQELVELYKILNYAKSMGFPLENVRYRIDLVNKWLNELREPS